MTILQNQSVLTALLPLSAYVTIIFNRKSKKDLGTFLNKYEKFLTKPLVLTVLVLLTKFIGNHVEPKTPKYLKGIFSSSFSKTWIVSRSRSLVGSSKIQISPGLFKLSAI